MGNRSRLYFVLVSFVLMFFLPSQIWCDGKREPFWVGIVGKNGVLAPIGIYSYGSWSNTWPKYPDAGPGIVTISQNQTVSKTLPLGQIPASWLADTGSIPENWYLLPGARKRIEIINTHGLVAYVSHCEAMYGIKTSWGQNYKQSENSWPRPKEGLALSAATVTHSPKDLTPPAKDGVNVINFLRPLFDRAEKNAGYSRSSEKDPVFTVRKVAWMASGILQKSLYFVAMKKEYNAFDKFSNMPCNDVSSYNAWVLGDQSEFKVLESEIALGDCSRDYIDWIEPLGLVVLDGKTYVLSIEYGYEWEDYVIRELDKNGLKITLATHGGGC